MHPTQHAVPFVLSRVEPKTTGIAEKHRAEVFTVVQYEDQMCIMNVHNHGWQDSLPALLISSVSSCFHVLHNGQITALFSKEVSEFPILDALLYVLTKPGRMKFLNITLTDTWLFFYGFIHNFVFQFKLKWRTVQSLQENSHL